LKGKTAKEGRSGSPLIGKIVRKNRGGRGLERGTDTGRNWLGGRSTVT